MTTSVRFQTGKTVFTRGVNDLVADNTEFAMLVIRSLARHSSGDWGDLDKEDKDANTAAVVMGERILSAYESKPLPKIWIITEHDRSVTTVLFPSEY
jgi:hypothetical protein